MFFSIEDLLQTTPERRRNPIPYVPKTPFLCGIPYAIKANPCIMKANAARYVKRRKSIGVLRILLGASETVDLAN
jgi:hypothetical protein